MDVKCDRFIVDRFYENVHLDESRDHIERGLVVEAIGSKCALACELDAVKEQTLFLWKHSGPNLLMDARHEILDGVAGCDFCYDDLTAMRFHEYVHSLSSSCAQLGRKDDEHSRQGMGV